MGVSVITGKILVYGMALVLNKGITNDSICMCAVPKRSNSICMIRKIYSYGDYYTQVLLLKDGKRGFGYKKGFVTYVCNEG